MGIYFIRNALTQNVTIGHSGDAKGKLFSLQQNTDCPLELVADIVGDDRTVDLYHKMWHLFRLGGSEWFSIDVFPDGAGGVSISGRSPKRKPVKQSFRHQHCVRLNDHQEGLLRRYLKAKKFETPSQAFRSIIDGLVTWFDEPSNPSSAPAQPLAGQGDSGLPQPTDVIASATSDVEPAIDVAASIRLATSVTNDVEEPEYDDETRRTGDFGGMLSVQLPESKWDGYE